CDNKVWQLRAQPISVIEVTGRAEPSYLKAGQAVRFYGEFDKRYKPVAPLAKLEVVSANMPGLAAGVFPDMLPPQDEKEKDKKEQEAKPADDPNKPDDNEAKATTEAGTPMMVVGTIKVVKDGNLLISA